MSVIFLSYLHVFIIALCVHYVYIFYSIISILDPATLSEAALTKTIPDRVAPPPQCLQGAWAHGAWWREGSKGGRGLVPVHV